MSFQSAAKVSLADSQLRRNIGKATTLIREKRERAVEELPDWQALRDAGEAIKASTMARLPELLEQLEEAVTRAGGTVHWARDGAEAARLHLRQKFLTVPVAVSGANFGIAESGTICVVESEGNGRMCLTLPNVLVTLMGIEKLLPTWQDLEVFLQLLPRSSTAERMNPYTSLWSGVREGDGPSEFHLILLDAGRTQVLTDEVGRQALPCIRC